MYRYYYVIHDLQMERRWSVSLLDPRPGTTPGSEAWRFQWHWRDLVPSLPILTWLPNVLGDKSMFISDLMAGLTVAVMVVPQV